MSRTVLPFEAKDLSQFARALNRELEACGRKPGHVQLLNMLTRSAGYRNYQHFRAAHEAQEPAAGEPQSLAQNPSQARAQARLEQGPPPPDPVDWRRVEQAARHFDAEGALIRWPSKANHQVLALWVLWSRMPARRDLTEPEVNGVLKAGHRFGDHATLRRALVEYRLMSRTSDCRQYRRTEAEPPPEALALIRHVGERAAA